MKVSVDDIRLAPLLVITVLNLKECWFFENIQIEISFEITETILATPATYQQSDLSSHCGVCLFVC